MSKPLLGDELWAVVAPLLSKERPKPKGEWPRISDRAAVTGILFVSFGCALIYWQALDR